MIEKASVLMSGLSINVWYVEFTEIRARPLILLQFRPRPSINRSNILVYCKALIRGPGSSGGETVIDPDYTYNMHTICSFIHITNVLKVKKKRWLDAILGEERILYSCSCTFLSPR